VSGVFLTLINLSAPTPHATLKAVAHATSLITLKT
jgi:hypothetical protein